MSEEVDSISMLDGEETHDYHFSPQHSKDDFLRGVLVKLALNYDTPTDIFSSTFEDVKQEDNEYLIVRTNVDIHITASIGHDRIEEYWDKETYYDNGVKRVRDVKKTRTVTDWSPFTCDHKGSCVGFVSNTECDDSSYITDKNIRRVIGDTPSDYCETVSSTIIPNDGAVLRARKLCGQKCMYKSLPGDRQRDESYSGEIAVDSIKGIVMPGYEVSYTYQGKEYNASALACGKLDVNCNYPSDINNVTKSGKKKALPFLIASPVAFVLSIVLAACVKLSAVWVPLFLGSIGLLFMYFIMKWVFINNMKNNRQKIKKKVLDETLVKLGMKPFDYSEICAELAEKK